jgi:hypothetical protein
MGMVRVIASVLALTLVAEASLLALDAKKAAYFGGTVSIFAGAEDPIEGRLDTSNEDALVFTAEKKPHSGQSVTIPWAQIEDLEYGQKAGRRVGTAVATTVLLGPIGLVSLFSKKRKHFLTVGYKDAEGKDQVAVLELGKDIVRATLPIVETRSGKEIEYQDEEAKKAASR